MFLKLHHSNVMLDILTLLQPGAEIFIDRLASASGNVLHYLANMFISFWIALKDFSFKVSPKTKIYWG